ncbi:MAG: glucose-1-phosphate cytidylyltransferase [Acidobacteria bacterium]|nr:glucose-1-phosphate cytidylyltransferase [Acidobacteriota bacterium]
MKIVILAGGLGTRLSEETMLRPKPMVEIGGKPLLWHIMKIYAGHGFKDFLVACGYKGDCIKEYFHSYVTRSNDYFIDLENGSCDVVSRNGLDWRVGMIDTGLNTMTGGRLLRLRKWLKDETFMVTYGDGVGNIDISSLLEFHRDNGKLATVTAVRPAARFGALNLNGSAVCKFSEKSQTDEGWINGGFFVFEPEVLDYLKDDDTILEREGLENIAEDGELVAFRHHGFWQPMDTLREKQQLEALWQGGKAPWASWAQETSKSF